METATIVMAALVLLIVMLVVMAAKSQSEYFANMMWDTPSWQAYQMSMPNAEANGEIALTYNDNRGVEPKNVDFNMETGQAIITHAGRYNINVTGFAEANSPSPFAIAIFKNSVEYTRNYSDRRGYNNAQWPGYGPGLTVDVIMDLAEGDMVEARLLGGILHGNANTSFSGHMISSAERPVVESREISGQASDTARDATEKCRLWDRVRGRCKK